MKHYLMLIVGILYVSAAFAAGKSVEYQIEGETFEGYFITPSSEAPLVFMIHDWDGLTEYEVKRAQMIAELGYAVFAADMFGKGVRPTTLDEKKRLTGALYGNRSRMRSLLDGAFQAAQKQAGNPKKSLAMGYCFGGAVALEFARSGVSLQGFAIFHGGLQTPAGQSYKETKGKLLILHGAADKAVPISQFAELAAELEAAGISHEMITYSGAPHAFTVFGSDRYREEADRKSWARFSEFLKETLD